MNDPSTHLDPPRGAFWARPLAHRRRLLRRASIPSTASRSDGSATAPRPTSTRRSARVADAVLRGQPWPVWRRREALHGLQRCSSSAEADFVELLSSEGCKPLRHAEPRGAARDRDRPPLGRAGATGSRAAPCPSTTRPAARTASAGTPASRSAWSPRSPRSTTRSTWWPTRWRPALIGGERRRTQALRADPADRARLPRAAARRRRPCRSHRRAPEPRRHRRGRAGQPPARRPGVLHRRLDHRQRRSPRAAGAKKTLMELGGNGTVSSCRDADVRPGGGRHRRRRLRQRRPELPVGPARVRGARALGRAARPGGPRHARARRRQQGRQPHRHRSAHRRARGRARRELGVGSRRGRRGRADRREARRRLLLADGAHRRAGRVPGAHRGGLRPGRLHRAVRLRRRRRRRGQRARSTGSRRASSPATSTAPWTSRGASGSARS